MSPCHTFAKSFGVALLAATAGFLPAQAPLGHSVGKSDQALFTKLQARIAAGKFHPFTGPVLDQNGNVRVKAGQVISDPDPEKMDSFVQGVASKMPGK
jgi:simple sugar transport system substrate-binding protein